MFVIIARIRFFALRTRCPLGHYAQLICDSLCAIDVEDGETDSLIGFEDVLDFLFEKDDPGVVVDNGFAGWVGKNQRYF